MVGDKVANLITSIKNAYLAGKEKVSVPYSKFTHSICEVLSNKGFVGSLEKKGKKAKKTLEITLVYENGSPRITGAKRISKLSKRVYSKSDSVRLYRNGYGISVYSTPKGVLSDQDAIAQKVGGELLFHLW